MKFLCVWNEGNQKKSLYVVIKNIFMLKKFLCNFKTQFSAILEEI